MVKFLVGDDRSSRESRASERGLICSIEKSYGSPYRGANQSDIDGSSQFGALADCYGLQDGDNDTFSDHSALFPSIQQRSHTRK